jgi:hypothetical protein
MAHHQLLLAHHWFGARAEGAEFLLGEGELLGDVGVLLLHILGRRLLLGLIGCGDGEHGFEGSYFVENGLALDVPTGDGSFDSQSICPFLTEKRKMREHSRISGRRLQPLPKLVCSGSID